MREHEIAQCQEKILKAYAIYRGVWLNEQTIVDTTARELPSGAESRVFLSRDGLYVTKITKYPPMGHSLDEFLDNRITLHNYLFRDTTYELLGFLEVDPDPDDTYFRPFRFVLKQPFIQGRMLNDTDWHSTLENERRLEEFMEKYLDMQRLGTTNFYNSNYIVGDLHLGNVLENEDGEFFFIDTVPRLNTIGPRPTDGKRRYEEWGIVYDNLQDNLQSVIL